MAAERIGWILNLDAEDELSHPGAHTPTRATLQRIEALIPRLRLLGPDDCVIWPGAGRAVTKTLAWMPTRFAREVARRAGVPEPEGPPMAVLRQVNHRAFCAALGQTLPGAAFVTQRSALVEVMQRQPGRTWLLKRPYGYAGRGRKRWRLAELELPWVEAGLAEGGLQVEPLVDRLEDWSMHGRVSATGEVTLGAILHQQVDATGAWRAAAPVEALPWEDALIESTTTAGRALAAAGYFGPFGVDAYSWRADDGAIHFQPRSEINARYTMGMHPAA